MKIKYHFPSVSEVVDGQHNTCAKVATMTLYDIPASQLDACSPGSLVFSECFLDSFIPLADLGQSMFFISFSCLSSCD